MSEPEKNDICHGCKTSFPVSQLTSHWSPMDDPEIAEVYPNKLALACPTCEKFGRWRNP